VVVEHSRHFEAHVQIHNFVGMRKHLIWYCRDFRGAAELRSKMVRVNNSAEVAQCLNEYLIWRDSQAVTSPLAAYDSPLAPQFPIDVL